MGSCVWGMAMLSMSSGEQASSGHLPSLQGGLQYKPCNEPLWHRSGRALSWWLSSVFQGLWVAKKLEVKVAQSCLTLRDPIGFTVRDIVPQILDPITNLERNKVKISQSCPTLRSHGRYSPLNSPGQNTGVGSLSLLQGIFPTQGSNPGLIHPHCRWILYQLSHQGSPRILE